MVAKGCLSVGSNHNLLTTLAFRLSQTIALGTPPKLGQGPGLTFDPIRQSLTNLAISLPLAIHQSAEAGQRGQGVPRTDRRTQQSHRRLELRADLRLRRHVGRFWRHRRGGAAPGIENAYLSYNDIKPFAGKMAIGGGTRRRARTISCSWSVRRRASLRTSLRPATSPPLSAWYPDRDWLSGYVRGPVTGAIHSASSITPNGTTQQVGVVACAAGQLVNGNDYTLQFGADAQWLIRAP